MTFAHALSPRCARRAAKALAQQEADTNAASTSETGGFGWRRTPRWGVGARPGEAPRSAQATARGAAAAGGTGTPGDGEGRSHPTAPCRSDPPSGVGLPAACRWASASAGGRAGAC